MLEKLNNTKTRSDLLGVTMILIFCGTSFFIGDAHGRHAATAEVPQLGAVDARLTRIQRAVDANGLACKEVVVDAAKTALVLPPITEGP